MNNVTITISGPVGSGKSALLIEIERHLQSLGVSVVFQDESSARRERAMESNDGKSALELYKPRVLLVENSIIPFKSAPVRTAMTLQRKMTR